MFHILILLIVALAVARAMNKSQRQATSGYILTPYGKSKRSVYRQDAAKFR